MKTKKIKEKPEKHCGTTGANLTYLATPGQFYMSAKSFTGTTEMQRMAILKDKRACAMEKCMVSMATINVILEHGVYIQNLSYIRYYVSQTTEPGLILKFRYCPFYTVVSNTRFPICIFMNFNENIKRYRKIVKIHI